MVAPVLQTAPDTGNPAGPAVRNQYSSYCMSIGIVAATNEPHAAPVGRTRCCQQTVMFVV
jgi:hypothetical protein